MYDELIKLINICLADNELSEKERTVIFNKAKQLGISDEECEVIIDSMIAKATNKSTKSEMRPSHSFKPKTITKISPPELNQTKTLENEKQQNSQNIQQLEIQQADVQQNISRLKEEKELLKAKYAESYKKAFCELNDNVLSHVESELTAKTKSKVVLTDKELQYNVISNIESKEELISYFLDMLSNKSWSMPNYKSKLEKKRTLLKILIWIFSILTYVTLLNYGKSDRPNYWEDLYAFKSFIYENSFLIAFSVIMSLLIIIQMKLKNRDKLRKPLCFNKSDVELIINNYFNNNFDIDMFFELAKTYKSTSKK